MTHGDGFVSLRESDGDPDRAGAAPRDDLWIRGTILMALCHYFRSVSTSADDAEVSAEQTLARYDAALSPAPAASGGGEAVALLDFCENAGRWCESAVVHGSAWHLTVDEVNTFERLRDELRAAASSGAPAASGGPTRALIRALTSRINQLSPDLPSPAFTETDIEGCLRSAMRAAAQQGAAT